MHNTRENLDLGSFLDIFPEVSPPLTITEESIIEFSRLNKPLAQEFIDGILNSIEGPPDEFTEFVPCFKFFSGKSHYSLVYWKGTLMNYQYVLITLDLEGNLIGRIALAGTFSNGKTIISSAATIDEAQIIHVVMGERSVVIDDYNPLKSKAYSIEILPDGKIISNEEDKLWEEKNTENREKN